MSEKMTIKETPGKPPEPTREEMIFFRDRYDSRIPGQDARVAVAVRAAKKAKEAFDAAKAELVAAEEARARLDTYIADLTAKIGA